jgi:nitrite reductase (NADH) large subunit
MKRQSLLCYCYAVTEDEVQRAIVAGAASLAALQATLKASTCCGGCEPRLRDCLALYTPSPGPAMAPVSLPDPAPAQFSTP